MRILVVCGRRSAIQHEMRSNSSSSAVHFTQHSTSKFQDGSEIVYGVVTNEQDTEKFRGLRFDAIIEHESFRGPMIAMDVLRAIVLR